jgi:hypothetical protein
VRHDAERALSLVIESECPLCMVVLRVHDGRACCQCCGDSYAEAANRLEIRACPEHSRRCEHGDAVLAAVARSGRLR